MTAIEPSILATDVGLWMSLPAFGPALVVVGVIVYVARRDRRRDAAEAGDESPREPVTGP